MDLEVSGAVLPRTAGSRSWGPETARPMPIRECPWHFGGDRTRNRACDGHAADSACRWRAFGCATAREARMPIRAPWTWMGATPHLGMPRSASGRMAMCIPILPSAAGSLPASSPCRKAIERRFEKTDYCARECQGPSREARVGSCGRFYRREGESCQPQATGIGGAGIKALSVVGLVQHGGGDDDSDLLRRFDKVTRIAALRWGPSWQPGVQDRSQRRFRRSPQSRGRVRSWRGRPSCSTR